MARFTADYLNSLTPKEVKSICSDLNIVPSFRKAACIESILSFQAAQAEVAQLPTVEFEDIVLTDSEAEEIVLSILSSPTCSDCPHFTRYEGEPNGRGWCSAFNHMARENHAATPLCPTEVEEIAPVATLESSDITLAFTAINIVPEPIIDNMDGSFDVLSSDRSRYYTVRAERCNCTAGTFKKPCRHINEVAQFTAMLQSQEVESYLETQVVEQWDIVEVITAKYGDEFLGVHAKVTDVFPEDLSVIPLKGRRLLHMLQPEDVRVIEKAPKKVEQEARPITLEGWNQGVKLINRATRHYQYGKAINPLPGYGSYQLAAR